MTLLLALTAQSTAGEHRGSAPRIQVRDPGSPHCHFLGPLGPALGIFASGQQMRNEGEFGR